MQTARLWRSFIILIVLSLGVGRSWAAESRPWVTLQNCEYVATKDADGDSFYVRSGAEEYNFRLYYVDAPEATLTYPERVREQSEHFGITLDATLKAGARARERVQELMREPFVVRTRMASAAGRGRQTRYYAIVEVGGKSLAEVLVSEGLAWTKGVAPNLPSGEKATAYMKRLEGLEREARQKRLGAWASAPEEKKEAEDGSKPDLIGTWAKIRARQEDGALPGDETWQLEVTFSGDGRFVWKSNRTQRDGTKIDDSVTGTWAIRQAVITYKFDAPSEAARKALPEVFAYWPSTRTGQHTLRFKEGHLVLGNDGAKLWIELSRKADTDSAAPARKE